MRRLSNALVAVLATTAPVAANAAPELGPAYGDNMVLQQGATITLSGRGQAGGKVTASLGNSTASAAKDGAGNFTLTLPALPATTTPLTLTLTDESGSATYANILIGEVFLCAGQSNMELSVNRALDTENQLRLAADDGIRLLMIPKTTAPLPQSSFGEAVEWKPATRDSVAPFSAACFYMAKSLRRKDPETPVGLIHSNWGGSAARAWLDTEGVRALHGQQSLD
ncbi:MAG TPA: Ig-like domain-containing protein, partial [Erythrobacter sp.]|nr:Ig-like domain-containing protein [Erythrobacter sp.]